MRRFTLPNLFLTVEGDEEEGEPGTEEGSYEHKDTPRSSPRALKEEDEEEAPSSAGGESVGQASPSSPRTPASPRRASYHYPPNSHCPLHCPHKTFIPQEESCRGTTETVPEEEEVDDERADDRSTSKTDEVSGDLKNLSVEDQHPAMTSPTTSSSSISPSTTAHKLSRGGPKSPKSPRSPISPRYGKMVPRTTHPDLEEGTSTSRTNVGAALICSCPDSCLQDIGPQEVPIRPGLVFGDNLRARIDGYRRQDSTVPGVPREKRSHSLATPGSLELPGCRRGLRPDALLVKGGFIRSKFKNRHQLSVTDSLDLGDDLVGFPGTPPPQATPPVHKDIPFMSSKLAKKMEKDEADAALAAAAGALAEEGEGQKSAEESTDSVENDLKENDVAVGGYFVTDVKTIDKEKDKTSEEE